MFYVTYWKGGAFLGVDGGRWPNSKFAVLAKQIAEIGGDVRIHSLYGGQLTSSFLEALGTWVAQATCGRPRRDL